jgi:hypothetical protein
MKENDETGALSICDQLQVIRHVTDEQQFKVLISFPPNDGWRGEIEMS